MFAILLEEDITFKRIKEEIKRSYLVEIFLEDDAIGEIYCIRGIDNKKITVMPLKGKRKVIKLKKINQINFLSSLDSFSELQKLTEEVDSLRRAIG